MTSLNNNHILRMSEKEISINSNHDCLRAIAQVLWECLPPEKYPSGLSTYDFMWKFRIPMRIHVQLLPLVNKLDLSQKIVLEQNIDGYTKGTTTVARVIVLIISEWYKWESPSRTGDGAMAIFPEASVDSQKVWDAAGLPDDLLHKAKKNSLRQNALCVLGGFPLMFAVEAERTFGDPINAIINSQEGDFDSWAAFFDKNSSVFTGSLASGSLKEYVDALWQYMETEDRSFLPFNEEDYDVGVVKDFCNKLREGYNNAVRDGFFKETHHIFTSDEDYSLQAALRVQIGLKKDNRTIAASLLEKIVSGMDIPKIDKLAFFLRAEYADGTYKDSPLQYYMRVGNGRNDFISVGLSQLSIEYDIFNIEKILLFINGADTDTEHYLKTFTVGPSLELYEGDKAYCWTTRKRPYTRKAILVDYLKFQDFPDDLYPIDKHSDVSSAKRATWNWINLRKTVTLLDINGFPNQFEFGNKQAVQVHFSYDRIKSSIRLRNGHVACVENDEPRLAKLLCGTVNSNAKSLNLSVEGLRNRDNYSIKFKEKFSPRYSDWTEDCFPSQGFITISVSAEGYDLPYIADVYYIKSSTPVVRNLSNNTITFKGVEGVKLFDPEIGEYIPLKDNLFTDTVPGKTGEEVADTIMFRVGDEDSHVILEVYRAFWMQELLQKGKPPKRFITSEKRVVPVIMHDQFTIRTFSFEGCQTTTLERIDEMVYDSFREGYLSKPSELCGNLPINSAVDAYVYKDLVISGQSLLLKVSPNHLDDYRFFFWKGTLSSPPSLVNATYNDNTGLLSLDCSLCRAERGVIFQSLKDCQPYNYYRPVYINNAGINAGGCPFFGNGIILNKELMYYCYQLYRDHRVYAAVFSTLLELRTRRTAQKDLLEYAIKKSAYSFTDEDVRQLNRLATEVGFDWMLLPRNDILNIIRGSEDLKEKCIRSLRALFGSSRLVKGKDNDGNNRYEQYYFNRIFIESNDYWNTSIRTHDCFKKTRYKSKDEARTFVELICGREYSGKEVFRFVKKVSSYKVYITLFHDVFYQYVIKQ